MRPKLCATFVRVACLCVLVGWAASLAAQSEPPVANGAAKEAAASPSSKAKTSLLTESRKLMGTWFEIKVEPQGRDDAARAAMKAALDEIARLEDVLSEWRPDTEISRLNRGAGGPAIALGPESYEVLATGQRVAKESDGAFDLTWAALRGLYRFEADAPRVLPDPKVLARQRALVGYRGLVLDPKSHTARLKRKGMAVGTGAIAKGYALDKAAFILEQAGFVNYLLYAGGQVQVHGARDGRPWRVGIRHPRKDGPHVAFFEVHDGSISTSGDYEHSYEVAGKRIHHIIDVKTGYPSDKSASVTLIARRGIDADALSTACFVLGPRACLEMLKRRNDGTQAVIIDPSMQVHMSEGMRGKVLFNPLLRDGRLPD